jgi:hypothetical protein
MTYTVWMQGKQIGQSRFEYTHDARRRAGKFVPTDFGLTVLPHITDMCPALMEFGDLCRRGGFDMDDRRAETAAAALDAFADTAEGRRMLGAVKRIAQIEVLDPLGQAVIWESLAITDVDELAAIAHARSPGLLDERLNAEGTVKFMISLTLAKRSRVAKTLFGVSEPLVEC